MLKKLALVRVATGIATLLFGIGTTAFLHHNKTATGNCSELSAEDLLGEENDLLKTLSSVKYPLQMRSFIIKYPD